MKLLGMILGLALAGCSTSTEKNDELAKVHKVAIIGLDIQQQKSVSGGDLIALATKSMEKSEAIPQSMTEAEHLRLVYQDLVKTLGSKTHWSVTSYDSLRKNAVYSAFVKERTEGLQNRPLINNRYVLYGAPGILDSWAVITTKKDRLAQLAKDLGVDAVVVVPIKVDLNNNSMFASLIGKGEFRPSAQTTIMIDDARTGEHIYLQSATGQVKDGVQNTVGMTDEIKLNELARQASDLSMDDALEKLKL